MYFSDSTGLTVDYSFILNECQPCCAVYSAVEICKRSKGPGRGEHGRAGKRAVDRRGMEDKKRRGE